MKPFEDYSPETAAPFIAEEEGFRSHAYKCPAQVYTIGYGHTGRVRETDTITKEEAWAVLLQDIALAQKSLAPSIKVKVTEWQFIALVSLAFNVGAAYVKYYCPKLLAAVNAKDTKRAAKEFLDITQANGKTLPGLVARRKKEAALYQS